MKSFHKKRLLRFPAFLLFQLAIVILIAEAFLTLFGHNIKGLNLLLYDSNVNVQYDKYDTVEDLLAPTVNGFTPNKTWRPGIRTNSRSFRTKEYTGARDQSLYTIATIGDSFNWGGSINYNKTWSVELEKRLDNATKDTTEVFAIGVPGTAAQFYLRLWELEKPRLRSNLVIVLFFVGNDFIEENIRAVELLEKNNDHSTTLIESKYEVFS